MTVSPAVRARQSAAIVALALSALFLPGTAQAADRLCDPGGEDCRSILLNYINNETVGIDVAFWFMEDARYTAALIRKFQEGVPVRVIVDSRANATYPLNADRLQELRDARIPMRERYTSGILHWKMMLFAGQNVVEFSGANYSADAWRPTTSTPYENYVDESIFFTDDLSIVNSFRNKYDDLWTDTTTYRNYANITGPLTRTYGSFPIDPELNLPPGQSYATRAVGRYNLENSKIDVIMYRITDDRHTDAMIAAVERGVPVRLITEPHQYRDQTRLWHSWNVDRMYVAGVQIRHRAHAGLNHQKSVLLYGLGLTIFGSSNWSSASANSQQEHNLFTTRPYIFQWFVDQFERKWNNATGVIETEPFAPLPPDAPKSPSPANAATGVATTSELRWYGGPWAHLYDVYLGTTPNPPLVAANLSLGPSESASDTQRFAPPFELLPGTTYYWRVVGRTMANMEKSSAVYSFTTAGTAPPPQPPPVTGTLGPGDVLLYASTAPVKVGTWAVRVDGSAAGAAAIAQPNAGAAKRTSALASPADYFELTFDAVANTPYRLWIRARAESNYWGNDSVFVQFSGSVTSAGTPQWRIGTTSATEMNLEDCNGCGLSGWGWQDNGYNALGPLVYFATTGPQTLRIQHREDGLSIDQIMLSPQAFLTTSPGFLKNDGTIYPEAGGSTEPPPPTVTVVRQPYLQQVTSTGAIVAWTTREAGPASVSVSTGGGSPVSVAATSTLFTAAQTGTSADYYQHVANVTGLSASTTYEYDVLVGGVDANSAVDRFTTAPSSSTASATFVAFGDSGTGSTAQQQIASRIASDTFDFALHAGDLAYGAANGTGGGTYATLESWFFTPYQQWLRRRPIYPSLGNHDSRDTNSNGRPYLDAFVLPEDGATATYPDHAERYYSFDYGPVHVIVLDTELAFQDTARRDAQLAWAEADLASTTRPWKVALYHRSPYSSGGEHGSDLAVRAAFAPLFEAGGVQLAISAHEHDYERTAPINGVTYVVTGGGGGPLYPAGTSSWTAASASAYHYLRGTATECTLSLSAIGTDGGSIDSTTLSRCTPPADTTPPTVSISSPSNGATVSGSVAVTLAASDDVGVVRAELLVDGEVVAADATAPFGFAWSSTSVVNGSHTLQARAVDAADNAGSSAVVTVTVSNADASGDIVLHAADAPIVNGGWRRQADSTAAGGFSLRHPNANAAKLSGALASPADYFEMRFEAEANVPYHLWIRGKADSNSPYNDSLFVQFSSIPAWAIGTTGATAYNLEDCSGCRLSGWGWQDNGWGVNVMGPDIVFPISGTQTIRIQTREDGLAIDQIILSPGRFLTTSPGTLKNDTTIYPADGGAPPPPDTQAPTVAVTSPSSGATVAGTVNVAVQASDNVGVSRVDLYVDGALAGTDNASPYSIAWNAAAAGLGAHTLQARAVDAAGNTGTSADVAVTVSDTPPPGTGDIVLYASDASAIVGAYALVADTTAAGGQLLRNPNAGAAKRTTALASPADYVEMTFEADANVPYHLWIRSRAQSNSWANDSVFVQFSGANGYGIGTTDAATMNLEDCSGCGLSGWGWQDNGWGANVMGPDIVFTTSGTHTIRIQPREDGLSIDQIVLSPQRFRTTSPGALTNDATIVER